MSVRARPVYDRWRDVDGTPIPDGCQVQQVEVDRSRGALRSRLYKRGVVISRGRSSRLQVRFNGEAMPVSMRPHLVRVLIEGGDGGRR